VTDVDVDEDEEQMPHRRIACIVSTIWFGLVDLVDLLVAQ
jgi:hypothetical protein